MDPVTVLSAFIPLVSSVITRVVDHFTGGPKPQNVKEQIDLNASEVSKLEALAKIDNADGASQWIVDVRAAQRPIAVGLILAVWGVLALHNGVSFELVQDLASSAVFYLFGDRTMMYINKKAAKKTIK